MLFYGHFNADDLSDVYKSPLTTVWVTMKTVMWFMFTCMIWLWCDYAISRMEGINILIFGFVFVVISHSYCSYIKSMLMASLPFTIMLASRGSALSNRIWNNTTLRSPKQQIWLRTALCGGWCRRMVLRNRKLHARNDDDNDYAILRLFT